MDLSNSSVLWGEGVNKPLNLIFRLLISVPNFIFLCKYWGE